ncbi:MAG: class II fructose-bisphosphate aldolase [Candidatus Bathyarchaeota archaeon]|nr:MAG: class II fructose-bisphosphate aldolase [Candidatus Bathyarchaeota archaeon]
MAACVMDSKSFDIEKTITQLVMTDNMDEKQKIAKQILDLAKENGIYPASIHEFYMARGRNKFEGFTVPAMNLRTMTYDLACAIFRVAKKHSAGAFIFEIAKSEIGYTNQPPVEFAAMVLAAAIKENYSGPVFIQGDHFQVKADKFKENPDKEIQGVKNLITDAINAGFYNIDIDSSTLVDLSKPTLTEQQRLNYEVCAKLTQFIRNIEPKGVTISVGGEIGEIGTQNSTPEDLKAYMNGLESQLGKDVTGISKISIQTGTTHGGVVLPDGSIAKIKLDFDTLKTLSEKARKEYGMAGAVQHGASTLPPEAFHKFVECETAEVHLATAFQNIIYESKQFPEDLKQKMYTWLKANLANERKEDQTEEQFIYKTRKKAFGQFKKEIMALPQQTRTTIATEVEKQFEFLFKQLNVVNTKTLVEKYCKQQ